GTICTVLPAERVAKGGGRSAGMMRRRTPGASLVQSPKAASPARVAAGVSSPRPSVMTNIGTSTVATAMEPRSKRIIAERRSERDLEAVTRHLPAGGLDRRAFGRPGAEHRVGVVDVDEGLARDAEIGERGHRSLGTGNAQMTHAASRLRSETGLDHFLVAPERAVEEQQRRPLDASGELSVDGGAGGNVVEMPSCRGRSDHQPDGILGALGEAFFDAPILEIKCDFAGHAE